MSDADLRTGRRLAGRLALAVLLVALAGCSTIPSSGPVKAGGEQQLVPVDDVVPVIGQPPAPGAKPQDIVLGFLQSSADFRGDHEVAREYLTPSARQRWRPQTGTVVYDETPAALPMSGGTVTIEGTEVGRIDAEGSFRRTPAGTPLTRGFGMEKVDGEWRIATLDDGLLLSAANAAETYRQVSLYFLAPSGDTVVPDSVLVPELPGLTTKLVTRLLRGPTAGLREAVDSAFPQGTELEVGSVPIRDGVATVRLNDAARQADDADRERMSAQIVWTLKQLSEVEAVRILAGGEPLVVSGVAEEQDRDAWPSYDPDQMPASPSAYLVRDGRVGRYLEGEFGPVPGVAGTGTPPLRTPAVSLDARRVAAVSTDGTTVYVGPLTRGEGLTARISGADLSQPSWDPDDNLWVVDRETGQLWYLADGADQAQEVDVVSVRRPTAVVVARDGTRLALLLGSGASAQVVVGPVVRAETANPDVDGGETLSVPGVFAPLPDLRSALDVAWADATTLAVLGSREGGPVAPFYVDTDGYDVIDSEPLPDPVSITAAPPLEPQENPLVVGTADGELMQFTSGGGWQPLGPGAGPAYPG